MNEINILIGLYDKNLTQKFESRKNPFFFSGRKLNKKHTHTHTHNHFPLPRTYYHRIPHKLAHPILSILGWQNNQHQISNIATTAILPEASTDFLRFQSISSEPARNHAPCLPLPSPLSSLLRICCEQTKQRHLAWMKKKKKKKKPEGARDKNALVHLL